MSSRLVPLIAMVATVTMLATGTGAASVQMGLDLERTNSSALEGSFSSAPPELWVYDSGNHDRYGRLSCPAFSDVDGDGLLEVFTASGDGRLLALESNGTPMWTFSTGKEWLFAPPAAGDVDGDGRDEIVFGGYKSSGRGDSNIYAVNGEDGSLLWTFDTERGIYLSGIEANPTLVDVNGDGAKDVLAPSDNYRFYILDGRNGLPLATESFEHFIRASVPVSDIDLDGRLEYLVADNHALTRLYEIGGGMEWQIYTTYGTTATPMFAQLDSDPELEIAVFNVGWEGKPQYPGAAMVYEHDGTLKWANTEYSMYYASPVSVDADGDGGLDLVGVTYYGAQLVAFDGADGHAIWVSQMPGTYYGSTPAAVDIDGDGSRELLVPAKPGLYCVDSLTGMTECVVATAESGPGGLMVVDLEGDGSPEILFTNGSGYLVCLGAQPPLDADIDFDPDSFNVRRHGRYATVYIGLPEGYEASDIVVSSITLNGEVSPLPAPTAVRDFDRDGTQERMVKFQSSQLSQVLPRGDMVEVTIEGRMADGRLFEGSDFIRVF